MALAAGTRLGSYEILGPVGVGGMGEVYRARDSKLHRDVAIKILPDLFARDPDRMARFEREAQTLASLNHTNIAQVFGVVDLAPSAASHGAGIVMEFVDGEDLAARLRRGAIPVDDTLAIARQIADALEAAHEQGIVHRDLKPANVKLRPDGTVKVLDFGLAKVAAADPSGVDAVNSPTFTAHATDVGVLVGTAAYMAPEQVRGRPADKRADIWAFGVVLYEMLSGRRAFKGEDVSEILAAVLRDAPDAAALPRDTPLQLRRLLERCLERDPKRRLRDIGDARPALEGRDDAAPGAPPPATSIWNRVVPWTIAAFAIIAAAALAMRPGPSAAVASFETAIAAPDGNDFQIGSNSGNVSISPDGTTIAFVAANPKDAHEPMLWVRPLARDEPRALSGTSGAFYPFWSPDGRSLGFFASHKLRTVEIAGGLPQVIADAENGRGGCWTDDGRILFTPLGGGTIFSVSAAGGAVTAVTKLNPASGDNAHYWPTCLPGSTHFLYFARSNQPENNGIYFARVDGTGTSVRVVASLSSALYAPPSGSGRGHLLWARDADLVAQPFDVASGQLSGEAGRIATGVLVEESQRAVMAGVSRTGVLVWASARLAMNRFLWMDRSGKRSEPLPIQPGQILQPRLSPDGNALAYMRAEKGGADIYLYDLKTGTSRRITTEPGYNEEPGWMPDGQRVVYRANGELHILRLDGSSPPAKIHPLGPRDSPCVTPDGRFVLMAVPASKGGNNDVRAVSTTPPHKVTDLLTGPGDQSAALVSPDGRWMMWTSNETGRYEGYLARLIVEGDTPRLGAQRTVVSAAGGFPVAWRRDGREIVYVNGDNVVVSVPVALGPESVSLGHPTALFTLPDALLGFDPTPAVTPDATRFLVIETPYHKGQTLRVLTDWRARLGGR